MRRTALWLGAILAAMAFASIAFWIRSGDRVAVRVATIERQDVVLAFVADGVVRTREAAVSPRIVGRLATLLVKEGQRVVPGQLLAVLDSDELAAAVQAAQGELRASWALCAQAESALRLSQKQSTARVRQARAQLAAAEAELRRVLAGARTEELEGARQAVAEAEARRVAAEKAERRARSLFDAGALPRASLERAEAESQVAAAQLAAARQRLELLLAGARPEEREAAQSKVEAARAELGAAMALADEVRIRRHDLEQASARVDSAAAALRQAQASSRAAELRAPFSATVQSIPAELGETLMPQTPAIVLVADEEPWVDAEIADQDANNVFVGQRVFITVASAPGRRFAGTVSEIAPHAELKPDIALRTRIVRAKIRLLGGHVELRPGLEVDVEGERVASKMALVVPNDAIVMLESATAVYVVDGGIARLRTVRTGFSTPAVTEILDGLREGEIVVVAGKDLLSDGKRVRVEGRGRAHR